MCVWEEGGGRRGKGGGGRGGGEERGGEEGGDHLISSTQVTWMFLEQLGHNDIISQCASIVENGETSLSREMASAHTSTSI